MFPGVLATVQACDNVFQGELNEPLFASLPFGET